MQFRNNDYAGGDYYSAMDHLDNTSFQASDTPAEVDAQGNPIVPDDALNFTPREIGTTTNPMGNTLESLKSRVKEGASRIEFEFIGQGKGNSQQPTPESFGSAERRDMRELLKINEMKTSTHASVHSNSLAGFTREGFSSEARAQALKEIKKAVNFAGEATKGGAVVFHLSEWQRPLSEVQDETGAKFYGYDEESKDATVFAVDARTGQPTGIIKKDKTIYRPKFITAEDKGLVGKHDPNGNIFRPGDWVDIKGNKIDRYTDDVDELFNRVPHFKEKTTNFETEALTWEDLKREANEYNARKGTNIKPEELYAQTEIINRVLQAKGSSLFHAQHYKDHKKDLEMLGKELKYFEHLEKITPEEEKWKLKKEMSSRFGRGLGTLKEQVLPSDIIKEQIKSVEDSMRHTHEASASADVQATEFIETYNNIKSAEKYGLSKTAETIAKAGMTALETYNNNRDKYELSEPIYVAPENWDPRMFGSHPKEYRQVIEESRKKMADMLVRQKGMDEEEAKKISEQHIKGTLDVGHLNLLRSHFERKEGESTEKFEKRFNKWMLDEAEKLVRGGYVGHIHLTDNFGFDDEHLTPGQGNVPMKEFLKRMEDAGIKDMIVEPGSYNISTSMPDTLALVNSPVYGVGRAQRFSKVRDAHFGYNAPGFFIAGTYSPSNDWRPWTEIPLE